MLSLQWYFWTVAVVVIMFRTIQISWLNHQPGLVELWRVKKTPAWECPGQNFHTNCLFLFQEHYNMLNQKINYKWDFVIMQAKEQYKWVDLHCLVCITGEGVRSRAWLSQCTVKSHIKHPNCSSKMTWRGGLGFALDVVLWRSWVLMLQALIRNSFIELSAPHEYLWIRHWTLGLLLVWVRSYLHISQLNQEGIKKQ